MGYKDKKILPDNFFVLALEDRSWDGVVCTKTTKNNDIYSVSIHPSHYHEAKADPWYHRFQGRSWYSVATTLTRLKWQ